MKWSRRFDDGGSNELIKPVLDTFDVRGDPIKRTDYYGKTGAPTTILEEQMEKFLHRSQRLLNPRFESSVRSSLEGSRP